MTEAAEVTVTLNKEDEDKDVTDGSTADVEEDNAEITGNGVERKKRKVKKKKKIYFRSDFVGGDSSCSSSDDEEDGKKKKTSSMSILDQNPKDMTWLKWCWYCVVVASIKTFHGAEFCGEKLADFFGITAPKYQYAINEYHRMKEEEREEEEREQREAECVRLRELEKLSNLETGAVVPDVSFVHTTS